MKLTMEIDNSLINRVINITCAGNESDAIRTSFQSLSSRKIGENALREGYFFKPAIPASRRRVTAMPHPAPSGYDAVASAR